MTRKNYNFEEFLFDFNFLIFELKKGNLFLSKMSCVELCLISLSVYQVFFENLMDRNKFWNYFKFFILFIYKIPLNFEKFSFQIALYPVKT
jgi:hypothetical protein